MMKGIHNIKQGRQDWSGVASQSKSQRGCVLQEQDPHRQHQRATCSDILVTLESAIYDTPLAFMY